MRILFLSSSLEPGRDGVGDYVRQLAAGCLRLGHECALLGLSDPCLAETVDSHLETADGKMPLLRLPATMDWAGRLERARIFRDQFRPDWISLQIVPYAFHPRGVLLLFSARLRRLTQGRAVHLMFHELWLGAGTPSPFRYHVIGAFQRLGIDGLLRRLQPRRVTTSNPVYASMLRNLQAEAAVLPLFGNIPVVKTRSATTARGGTGIAEVDRGNWWIGLFFGALHEQWKPEPFLTVLERAARRSEKRIALVSVGRMGSAGEAIWKKMENNYGSRINFSNLGEQPPEIISPLLQSSDFGIAASPWQLIGKSGAAAAMLDHGLPVIVTRDDFQPYVRPSQPPSDDPLIHRFDSHLEAKLAAGLPKRPPVSRVDEIAARFCELLSTAPPSAS